MHLGDVLQGIPGHGDEVGVLALFDGAHAVLHADDRRIDRRRHSQRVDRGRSPLDEDREHLGLHAVRTVAGLVEHASWRRRGAAPETKPNTGGQHFLPGLLHQAPAAVGRKAPQVARFILPHVQNSGGHRQVFLEKHFDVRVVGCDRVLDVVDPCFERPFEAVASITMGGDEQTASMRFIHRGLELLETRKRLVHHIPVRLEDERAGRRHLDMVDAVVRELAHGCAHRLGSIGNDVRAERFEVQRKRVVSRRRDIQDRSGDQQTRPPDEAALDRFAQLDIGVSAAMRPHHHLRGEAGVQALRGAVERHHHLMLQPSGRVGQVQVTVNQAREHGRLAQVDHPGAGGNLYAVGGTGVADSLARDEHNLIGDVRARPGIEHAPRANRDHLSRLGLSPHDCRNDQRPRDRYQSKARSQHGLPFHGRSP